MIGSCDWIFILTKHWGILYADIVTIYSIEVYSFYLCAALLLHSSSIILLCSAMFLNLCLFIYIIFVCFFFTYFISIISWSLKLEQITPPHWLCHAYYKVSNIFIKLWKMILNVIFTLIKFSIEFGLNPALAVVCLFIYILLVFLFTYFISIISLSLKL